MRFRILWLDAEGFAHSGSHLDAPSFERAVRFAAWRQDRIKSTEIAGFVISHADSEFMRRYMRPGGPKQTRAETIDKEEMREDFPHLFKE